MKRLLESAILKDLKEKIVILSGPRQVGKTTLSQQINPDFEYFNFDSAKDRKIIKEESWDKKKQLTIFDEIHKMRNWKSWIKGVFDTHGIPPAYLVTGSARLDIYKKGGDSLAGRHFSYRLHPTTVREALPFLNSFEALNRLIQVGGFPEPFLRNDPSFAKRWRRRHLDTVIRQDLIDLERVRDIKSIEILADLLRERVGSPVSFSSLAGDLQVSIPTVKHWLQILENLFVIFPVRPYHKNIARSLLKEPKYYFYDTGAVEGNEGIRLENAVAGNLLAELHHLEDTTGSRVALHYLKDKEKHEVDFCVVVDKIPKALIEVKYSNESFSPHLFYFQRFFPDTPCYQLIHQLSRTLDKKNVTLLPAHEYLREVSFA